MVSHSSTLIQPMNARYTWTHPPLVSTQRSWDMHLQCWKELTAHKNNHKQPHQNWKWFVMTLQHPTNSLARAYQTSTKAVNKTRVNYHELSGTRRLGRIVLHLIALVRKNQISNLSNLPMPKCNQETRESLDKQFDDIQVDSASSQMTQWCVFRLCPRLVRLRDSWNSARLRAWQTMQEFAVWPVWPMWTTHTEVKSIRRGSQIKTYDAIIALYQYHSDKSHVEQSRLATWCQYKAARELKPQHFFQHVSSTATRNNDWKILLYIPGSRSVRWFYRYNLFCTQKDYVLGKIGSL